jgi:transcriptional regulator with XRE-family HTH domain
MNHRDYVAAREARDPAFKAARETLRPQYEWQRALIQARLAAGLTQQQLADLIGKHQAAIARLESGIMLPKLDTVYQIASALNATFTVGPGKPLTLLGKPKLHRKATRGAASATRAAAHKSGRRAAAIAAEAAPSAPRGSGRRPRAQVK